MSTDNPSTTHPSDGTDAPDEDSDVLNPELVRVDDIIPYANNPKEHPDHQINDLASSIKNTGFDQHIVVDGSMEIIKGHGRYQAVQKLGWEDVPVIVRRDLTTAQAKAARIADNKTHMNSGWDLDALALELEETQDLPDISFDDTAFDEAEAEAIIEQQDVDIDSFFEEADGEDTTPTDDPLGSETNGWVECPECGHEFEHGGD